MTWKYKALALGAGFAAALTLSACGRHNNVTSSETPTTTTESGAPATSGAEGTMGATESGAPATSSSTPSSSNPGG